MSTEQRPLDLPAQVGRYVLGPVVGLGGFAVVVRARDESLDADVAVKVLTARYALDPEIRERFVREARLLRRVRSPAVVTVHDVGETTDGRPYLVMDLADGGVLQDRLASVDVPVDAASLRAVVSTLADGLGALHAAGVIHRDVKPANLLVLHDTSRAGPRPQRTLLAPGERLVIGDLGLAKDQLATAYGPTMVGGTPRFQAPEQTVVGAPIDARTDVYAASAVLWVLLTGERPPTPDELPARLPDVASQWREVVGRGLAAHPDDRFRTMEDWAAAVLGAVGADATQPAPASRARAATTAATFPYKGLAAFQPEDAPLFFGRTDLVDQLVARLGERPVLVIGGPSGSGKSSLARAGLLAALSAGALPGSQRWPAWVVTPGPDAARALDGVGAEEPFVVVVDQLEELFAAPPDSPLRRRFLDRLAQWTGGANPRGHVVLVVRADFYAACAAEPWLAAAINDSQVLVGPMTRAQLREAIEGPARRVGLHLETGLVERILDDAGGDAGALPLVGHALVETWLRREGAVLTNAGYAAAGGVAGAVARTADRVWERLDPAAQPAARRLLLQLVRPGDGTPDTKRLLPWSDVRDDDASRSVISAFADNRLLTLDEEGVQLAHEALLRSWPRLAAWVEDNRDDLRAAERIDDAAREWERQGRHADLLYRGVPLDGALEWRQRRGEDVAPRAAAFLEASEAARDAARRAEAARQQRSIRVRRRVLVSLAALTVLALLAMVFARRDAGRARAATRLASQQLAASLAATSQNLHTRDPYLAAVLAAESVARAPSIASARDALVQSRVALAGDRLVPFGDPIPVDDALAVAVRPAGDLAATGNRDGSVGVWNLARRTRAATLTGPRGAVQQLVFTADGRWLVGASADGRVWRWRVDGTLPAAGSVVVDAKSVVWSVAAAPSSDTIAAVTESGDVWLVDAATGATQGDPLRPNGGELLAVAFSPDGSTLLAGSGQGEVYAWSLPSRQPRFAPFAAHTSDIWEIVVRTQQGVGSFVTVSDDGTARLWDLATGARVPGGPFDTSPPAMPTGVRGATFSPSGDVLTLGGPDGSVYSWSLDSGRSVDRLGPVHRDRITSAARSSDGLTLVTLGDDRTVQVWTQRPRPAAVTRVVSVDSEPGSLSVSPKGDLVAVGARDGTVRLLDATTGEERRRLGGQGSAVGSIVFTSEHGIVTGDADGTLRAWDVVSGRVRVSRRDAHKGAVTALAVRGRTLVSGGDDGGLRRWDASSLAPRATLGVVGAPVTHVVVAPSSGLVVAATSAGSVARWVGSRRLRDVAVTDNAVWSAAVDATGTTLATADGDEVLSFWSPATSSSPVRRHQLAGHRNGALDTGFVDAHTVAVTSGDGALRLWDAGSGTAIGPPLSIAGVAAWHLAIGPDATIWVAAKDGGISRIDVLSVRRACAEAAASLDARQRARLFAGRASIACVRR